MLSSYYSSVSEIHISEWLSAGLFCYAPQFVLTDKKRGGCMLSRMDFHNCKRRICAAHWMLPIITYNSSIVEDTVKALDTTVKNNIKILSIHLAKVIVPTLNKSPKLRAELL